MIYQNWVQTQLPYLYADDTSIRTQFEKLILNQNIKMPWKQKKKLVGREQTDFELSQN